MALMLALLALAAPAHAAPQRYLSLGLGSAAAWEAAASWATADGAATWAVAGCLRSSPTTVVCAASEAGAGIAGPISVPGAPVSGYSYFVAVMRRPGGVFAVSPLLRRRFRFRPGLVGTSAPSVEGQWTTLVPRTPSLARRP